MPPSRIASNQLEDRASAVWASKQILKRREAERRPTTHYPLRTTHYPLPTTLYPRLATHYRREAEIDLEAARRDAVLAHRAHARGRLHDTHLIRHASQESLGSA